MPDDRTADLREAARRDLRRIVAGYEQEAGVAVAVAFVDAVDLTLEAIERRPAIGSPRVAVELDLPGLRAWPVPGFPHVVFHLHDPPALDVVRVLHERQHLGEQLGD